jgi:hypothetical protein
MTKPKRTRRKKLREWSHKVNDPRQLDLIDYVEQRERREGFARLELAIAEALAEAGVT